MIAPPTKRPGILFAVILAALTILLFWRFVDLYFSVKDLPAMVLCHRAPLTDLLSRPEWRGALGRGGILSILVLFLETRFFGDTAWLWNLLFLVVHLLNVMLLYRAVRWIAGPAGGAAAALLFAWHPLLPGLFTDHAAGVNAGFLMLFTLLCLNRFAGFRMEGKVRNLWLSALFMMLAVGFHEWYALPVILILYDLALPRPGITPSRLRGLVHHVPLWIGFGITSVLGYQWNRLLPAELSPAYLSMELLLPLWDCARGASGPLAGPEGMDPMISILGGTMVLLLAGVALLEGVIRRRDSFTPAVILFALILLAAAIPDGTVDPTSARPGYGILAFFCLFMGLILSGGRGAFSGDRRRPPVPLVLALLPALYFAGTTLAVSPGFIRAGTVTREIRDQVHQLAGPVTKEPKPVFLFKAPAGQALPGAGPGTVPGALQGSAPGALPGDAAPLYEMPLYHPFEGSLGLLFTPPFSDTGLQVYPVNDVPYLSDAAHVPFMMSMWGEGTVLEYDAAAEKVVKRDFSKEKTDLLLEYLKKYSEGERLSLIRLERPVPAMAVAMQRNGFPVTFPFRKASLYRMVVLNRYGPGVLEAVITKEQILKKRGKPQINIYFNEKGVRRALQYFNREPVYFWVEAVDEGGDIFHRSPLILFNLYMDE